MNSQQFCNFPMLRDFSEDDNMLLLSALESGNQNDRYGFRERNLDRSGYNYNQFYQSGFEPEVIYSSPQTYSPPPEYGSKEFTAPREFPSSRGYSSPQEYTTPQEYGSAPQKYASTRSYSSPQEYTTPQEYGLAPQTYSAPHEYAPREYTAPQKYSSPQTYSAPQEFCSESYSTQPQYYEETREDYIRQQQNPQVKKQGRSNSDEIEYRQLQQLCSKLEEENERISVENQFLRNQKAKPPLYRSFSKEMRDTDKELDTIIARIRSESRRKGNEEQLRNLLYVFKQLIKSRQRVQSEETQQFAHPKLQERLSRLSKQPHVQSHLRFDIQTLSQEQIMDVCALRETHLEQIGDVFHNRDNILSDIRNYYSEKIIGEQVVSRSAMIESKEIGNDVILVLSNKIDSFKRNIEQESRILLENLVTLTHILTPSQQALIVLEYYNTHKENFSLYNLLSTIWDLFV